MRSVIALLYVTTARTELDNIRYNLAGIRARVGTSRLILAAVKANAYGHGAVAVSRMLERTQSADWLGVATVGEGIELRAAGITLPILKLSHVRTQAEARAALEHQLTLPVVDEDSIRLVADTARHHGVVAPVHLKVDTGMRRIGCEPEQAVHLVHLVDSIPELQLEGMFSHLPTSDSPAGAEFTKAQIALFATTADTIEAIRGRIPLKHLANSGAVLGHPGSWFDMVRPGVMIYGNYPDPESSRTVDLRPGIRLSTAVSFVKCVPAGETVGYGRTWVSDRDSWIATLPVGYADGYSRLLSNRGRVLIKGRSYPLAGRVCMDQCMVDLGPADSDNPPARVGDEAILIGASGTEQITVQEIADRMHTITYEVTCLIGGRVTRTTSG